MTPDEFPCPVCGKPRPWHAWWSKDGRGCRHPGVSRTRISNGHDDAVTELVGPGTHARSDHAQEAAQP